MRLPYPSNARHTQQFVIGFLTLLFVYFSTHLFLSERSVSALIRLESEQQQAQQTLAALQAKKDELQARVIALRPDSLDTDLVESYAIQMLGHNLSGGYIMVDEKKG